MPGRDMYYNDFGFLMPFRQSDSTGYRSTHEGSDGKGRSIALNCMVACISIMDCQNFCIPCVSSDPSGHCHVVSPSPDRVC